VLVCKARRIVVVEDVEEIDKEEDKKINNKIDIDNKIDLNKID
jgi:hypothetical protein